MSNNQRYRVLIIDDSQEDRSTYRRYLQKDINESFEVIEADSAEFGLEICQKCLPDVILLDYLLPDVDGLTFLEILNQQLGESCIPVVMLTGHGNEMVAIQAMKRGVADYLIKGNLTSEILCRTVNHAIAQFQLQQQLSQQQKQQQLIGEIALRIRQSLNLEEILQTTVNEVRQLIKVDRVIIFEFNTDWGGKVTFESVLDEKFAILPFNIYDPCIGEHYVEPFKQGAVTAKADIYTADISPCHVEFLKKLQVRANLVIPILKNNELWGLLVAHHCTAPREWLTHEIHLLQQIAVQVGIAIQQANLLEQVQKSAIRTQILFKTAFDGIVILDEQGKVLDANPRFAEMLGYSLEETQKLSVFDWDAQFSVQEIQGLLQNFESGILETCHRRKDGSIFNVEISTYLVEQQENSLRCCFCRDITERKQAIFALQESESRFRALADAMFEGIIIQENGKVIEVNDGFTKMSGYAPEEVIGKSITNFMTPESSIIVQQYIENHYERPYEITGIHKNGTFINLEVVAKHSLYQGREVRIAALRNITQRKQIEESLKQSEARLRLAQIASNSGVWDWDLVNNKLIWSPEYYQLYGLDPNTEANYENWLRCVHPDDRELVSQQTLSALEDDNTHLRVEFRVIQSGQIRWFAGIGQVIRDEQQNPLRMIGITLDITEQKQTEIALQQLNTELEQRVAERTEKLTKVNEDLSKLVKQLQTLQTETEDLYNNAPCGYHSLDAEGTFVRINNTELRWLGYSREEILYKKKFKDFLKAESLLIFQEHFPRFIQQGKIKNLEFQLIHQDGSTRWVNVNSIAIRDEAGNFLMSRTSLFDITERKQAIVNLQKQIKRNQLLWHINQAIRQSLDLNTILETATAEVRKTIGVDRVAVYQFNENWSGDFIAESVGDRWIKLVEPMVCNIWEDTYLQETKGGRFQNNEILTVNNIYTADLQPCHIELLEQFQAKAYAIAPIFVNNSLWGLLGIYQNAAPYAWDTWEIDLLKQIANQLAIAIQQSQLYSRLQIELQERKQTEVILREAERRWRSLLENVQLIVVGLDQSGDINYVNPFFLELSGYQESEVLGKNWFENFLPFSHQQSLQVIFSDVLHHSAYPYYKNSILTKSGEEKMIAWNNTVLKDANGNPIGTISIGEDITERQKVEAVKDEFIGIVSHELRTPLMSIQMSLGLLQTDVYAKKPEKAKRMIDIAFTDTKRLVNLVNDILDLERLESGRVNLEKTVCWATDLIQQAVNGTQAIATQQNITFEIIPNNVIVWAAADSIIQTLTNLLSNALKFSPAHSVIQLQATYQENYALFQVRDQGRGIPEDKLEAIFGRFQQVDASDSREKGGTGLGLSICRSIVEKHGGKIWAESVLGQGSTFCFTLPISGESEL